MHLQYHFDHYGTTRAKSAVVSGAVATTEIVAAPASDKKIRVLGWLLSANATAVSTWKSATTAKTGPMVGYSEAPFNPVGWFDCEPGEALNLTVGTATAPGVVSYAIVDKSE